MEDRSIIELFQQRNEQAIGETSAKYAGYCGRIVMNILRDREDAEECLNDAWLRAWNTIPPQEPRSLRIYLGCLARTVAINLYNRKRAQKRYQEMDLLLSELDECIPGGRAAEEEAEGAHLSALLSDWLRTLPEGDRRVFIRRYWYAEPVQELARECGCSANALASRMKRLRQALKSELEKEGIIV